MGIRERITNLLLLLYLVEKANAAGDVEDELKLQKLVFLAQKKLVERQLKAFSYNFFRWRKGPFSKNLRIDLLALVEAQFLRWRANKIELTDKAKGVLETCSELLDENEYFLRWVNDIILEYSHYSSEEIKDLVYSLKVVVPRLRQIMTIKDIPPRQLILFKTADKNARMIFDIDKSWLATLELTFDKEALDSLSKALDDAVEGRAYELNL